MENKTARAILIKDINPGSSYGNPDGSFPNNFTEFEERLFFTANDGETGDELWVSDLTSEGTQLLKDIDPGSSEGFENGSYPDSSFANNFTEFEERLFFTADDGETGDELWVSDGTSEGTQLLKDINPGSSEGFGSGSYPDSSFPNNFTEFEERLFFAANDGETGNELWVSDGTSEGTQLLKDINPNSNRNSSEIVDDSSYPYPYISGSNPSNFTEFEDQLFFTADDGETGNELWVSDGTSEGTQLLKDINPGSSYDFPDGSFIFDFTEFKDQLFFTADDGENGNELWVSDGTSEGTQLLKDINPGSSYDFPDSSNASDFTEFEERLFFAANDGETGNELWVSDGTSEGTQLLKDINPNSNRNSSEIIDDSYYPYPYISGSNPSNFTEFKDQLFFTANDGENGNELWVSDGTSEGTQLLKDINPGSNYGNPNGSYASNFTEFEDQLFFTANNGENGNELWVSDGTSEGTQLLVDINPGSNYGNPNGSYAYNLTVINDELVFSANDNENGNELFKLAFVDVINNTATNGSDNLTGGGGNDLIDGLGGSDTVDGGNGNDTLLGGDAQDFLLGGFGNDSLLGEDGSDTLDGGEGNDTLFGGNDDDFLLGSLGNDSLLGEDGSDTLDGGEGNDTLFGGNARDFLLGSLGDDSLLGEDGSDTLDGGEGNDTLFGGNGDDSLVGGAGDDSLLGGNGRDVFVIEFENGGDTIIDFELGSDRLSIGGDLKYDDLTFSGSTISAGEELLVTLNGVDTEQFTNLDFTVI